MGLMETMRATGINAHYISDGLKLASCEGMCQDVPQREFAEI